MPDPAPRVLHLLSQRPGRTGSGTTLNALTAVAAARGWEQAVLCGVPAGDPAKVVAVAPGAVHPLEFGTPDLPFPVAGMSDVMPYESTVFSRMSTEDLARYRTAWRGHIAAAVRGFQPDVIHTHHVWLMSSLAKEVAPQIPSVLHCHATGLRQMELCPHLAGEVRRGCARHEHFAVLHEGHRVALREALGVGDEKIHIVGAGYDAHTFHPGSATPESHQILYVGKISRAKGLAELLDAVAPLDVELQVVGGGSGDEAEALGARMAEQSNVTWHGRLETEDLVRWMQRCAVCVLPSFYEGLPLVLVEAAACGARLVATALPGVRQLANHLGPERIHLVEPPTMASVDRPDPDALPGFVERLRTALDRATAAEAPVSACGDGFRHLTWDAVGERVESIWQTLRP